MFAQGRSAEARAAYPVGRGIGPHGNLAMTQTPFGLHVLQTLDFRPKGILDVGAFEGAFARTARHFVAQFGDLTVEAQPAKEVQLKAVAAQLPDPPPASCRRAGQSRQCHVRTGTMRVINSSGSSLYEEQTRYPRDTISLPMRTLDDVLAEMPGREFDLLKTTMQAAEIDVAARRRAQVLRASRLSLTGCRCWNTTRAHRCGGR